MSNTFSKAPPGFKATEITVPETNNKDTIYMLKGKDLDLAVAKHVFGCPEGGYAEIPAYSSDLIYLDQIIQKIHSGGYAVRFEFAGMGSGYWEYSAALVEYDLCGEQEIYKVRADTLAVAICQLALLDALQYPWDKFESHYFCKDCGKHLHESKGSNDFTQMHNLFKSYPHFRDEQVREYLEDKAVNKNLTSTNDTVALNLSGSKAAVNRLRTRVGKYVDQLSKDMVVRTRVFKETEHKGDTDVNISVWVGEKDVEKIKKRFAAICDLEQ